MTKHLKKTVFENHGILAAFLGLAYANGVLNFQHILPSSKAMYISLISAIIICFGVLADGFIQKIILKKEVKTTNLGLSSIATIFLLILFLCQPVLNTIIFVDTLIFPIATVLVATILSIIIVNISDKKLFIVVLAFFTALTGVLHVFTHFAHLYELVNLYNVWVMPIEIGERPTGNLAQPNQAAFVYAIAMAAILFFTNKVLRSQLHGIKRFFVFVTLFISFILLAIGVALSASRAGIILAIASLSYWLILSIRINYKTIAYGASLLMLSIGYYIGNILLTQNSIQSSAIKRVINGEDAPLRIYQIKDAWLIIQDNPITGIGWKNFAASNLKHAEQLNWFSFSDHSHMIFSQVAAEFGILGLLVFLPLIILVIKNFHFSHNSTNAFCITTVAITLLYSLSEFPLWYFTFFITFIIFLACIDSKTKFSLNNFYIYKLIIMIIMFGLSIFYTISYKKYSDYYYSIINEPDLEKRNKIFKDSKSVFGFSHYDELIVYTITPVTKDNVDAKLAMGNRIIRYYPIPAYLNRQAALEIYKGNHDNALKWYKASCVFFFAERCNALSKDLEQFSKDYPEKYSQVWSRFKKWREENPKKTGLLLPDKVTPQSIELN